MLLGTVLSLLTGGVAVHSLFPAVQWIHSPLHVFLETLGAFTALMAAALLTLLKVYERIPARYIWVVAALAGMGVLDGFHALSQELQRFVWLHSLAMLLGGLMASLIWLPESIARRAVVYRLPLVVMLMGIVIGSAALHYGPLWSMLDDQGRFSASAIWINVLGGGLFLATAVYFLLEKRHLPIQDSPIFFSHYLLLGTSGLMFPLSMLWDGAWWYWHLLRFAAYALVFLYLFLLSRSEERQLFMLNTELEARVKLRTHQLKTELKERKTIEKMLKHQATHDPLTGLFNRNELERRINDDIARSIRYQHPLSIFMVDIDHFKEINDRYGHANGDRVLRSIAFELERSLRKTDYVARYGGEEFLVVLPETPVTMAVELGERLLRQVANHRANLGDDSVSLTISIGVASYPETAKAWHELLDTADGAMYQAKKDGRNCLRIAQSLVS